MAERPLSGPNILLEGPSGTGKTFALGGLVDWAQAHDMRVNALFVENGLESLLGYWRDVGTPPFNRREPADIPSCLAWHQQLTVPVGLGKLMAGAELVGKSNFEMLSKWQDNDRQGEKNAFWKILQSCSNFPDDRTGKQLGGVDSWGVDTIFVIDSLSELSNAAMKMVIGSKPTAAPPDYGVAQNNLMNFLRLCTQGIPCTFVLIGHVDRDVDELTGASKIMTKAIGKALRDEIPPLFSEVIFTVREGDKFYWDTAMFGVDAKTRSLGYRQKIPPDFSKIMDIWLQRGVRA